MIDWCLTAGKILPPPKKEKFTRGIWTHFIDYYTVLQNSSICRCERCFARFNVLSLWLGRRAQGTVQCGDWTWLWIRARKALSHTLSVQLVRRYEGITGSRFVSPDLIWSKYLSNVLCSLPALWLRPAYKPELAVQLTDFSQFNNWYLNFFT